MKRYGNKKTRKEKYILYFGIKHHCFFPHTCLFIRRHCVMSTLFQLLLLAIHWKNFSTCRNKKKLICETVSNMRRLESDMCQQQNSGCCHVIQRHNEWSYKWVRWANVRQRRKQWELTKGIAENVNPHQASQLLWWVINSCQVIAGTLRCLWAKSQKGDTAELRVVVRHEYIEYALQNEIYLYGKIHWPSFIYSV